MWLIQWFQEQWPSIVTVLTSSSFISTVILFTKAIFQNKKLASLNAKLKALTNDFSELSDANCKIENNIVVTEKLSNEVSNRLDSIEETMAANNIRFGAIIDILGVVHMRSKDEDIRNAVSSIINTFEHRDNIDIANLKDQLKYLQQELENTKKDLAASIEKQNELNAQLSNVSTDEEEHLVMRG